MTSEKVVGAHTYRIGRLNAKAQLHIVRRIAPVFADSAPMVLALIRRFQAGEKVQAEAMIEHFGSAANAFKSMSDDDVDYVIDKAMSVVERQMQGGTGWARMTAPNGVMMFQDLTWPETLQIVWLVIQENVLNFFAGAPSA